MTSLQLRPQRFYFTSLLQLVKASHDALGPSKLRFTGFFGIGPASLNVPAYQGLNMPISGKTPPLHLVDRALLLELLTKETDPSATSIPYQLCTTAQQVENSLSIIRAAEYLAVDSEGQNLGDRNGQLSLLSIGAYNQPSGLGSQPDPASSHIFVYDVLLLPSTSLERVFAILSDSSILKVMWDGRMDYTELYHSYSITIRNVLDLQIAEVMSRGRRGETNRKRKQRLTTFFREVHLEQHWDEYDQVHMLLGMGKCLEEHGLAKGIEGGKDPQMKEIFRHNASVWLDRPLLPVLVSYAAKDIYLIHVIYTHFFLQSYLSRFVEILTASQRYISQHSDLRQKPDMKFNCYHSSPVLPLDMLEEPKGETYVCQGCERKLSLSCYPHNLWKRHTMCRVCRVVGMRMGKAVTDLKDKDNWVDI